MKLGKAAESLGKETMEALEAASPEELKSMVVKASEAMRAAEVELEANEAYQEAKENLKVLSAGKRDVFKRQKAIILVALSRLNAEGS